VASAPVLVRYADDFIVAGHSQRQAERIKAQLTEWLAPWGLALNEDKTSIRHASAGFDFLGFSICRYPNGKLIIKPSTAAIRRIRERLRQAFRRMRGATAEALIRRLNQIISGWAAYYRTVVSSKVFTSLDDYVWKLAYKWATHRHRTKPKKWIAARYVGRFHPARTDRWIFGDRDSGVTCANSPGRKSSGTRWSPLARLPTTPPWPTTGPPGAASTGPRWANTPCACCTANRRAARSAGTTSCTPTTNPPHPRSGNSGSAPSVRRSPSRRLRSSNPGDTARQTGTHPASYTARPSQAMATTSTPALPPALAACLSRVRGKPARPVLRGVRRSNAPHLPDLIRS
jgi:Group II intron, maturase-specific domain/Reverse transcriptase (RNA-dependent DNA polymerase)